jgi:hypothetical protein
MILKTRGLKEYLGRADDLEAKVGRRSIGLNRNRKFVLCANLLSGGMNRLRTAPDDCHSKKNSSTHSSGHCRTHCYDRRPLHISSLLGQ